MCRPKSLLPRLSRKQLLKLPFSVLWEVGVGPRKGLGTQKENCPFTFWTFGRMYEHSSSLDLRGFDNHRNESYLNKLLIQQESSLLLLSTRLGRTFHLYAVFKVKSIVQNWHKQNCHQEWQHAGKQCDSSKGKMQKYHRTSDLTKNASTQKLIVHPHSQNHP